MRTAKMVWFTQRGPQTPDHSVPDVVVVDVDAVEGSCVLGKISWDFGCRRT